MVADTTFARRLQTKPEYFTPELEPRGVPVGVGDWRLVIERLVGTGSVVGACTVGSPPVGDAVVGALGWQDLTSYWRGHESFRGADEPFGRPRVGEITLTLDNRTNIFTPWVNYAPTRPGTIIRCGLVSAVDGRADGWLPVWTGRVASWPVLRQGVRSDGIAAADNWVDVTLDEMLSELANVDANALGSVVGTGDNIMQRVDRLLTAAQWRYGLIVPSPWNGLTLQSTDMSLNRLAELYVAADSTDSVVRSDVTGAVMITAPLGWLKPPNRLAEFSVNDVGEGAVRFSMIDAAPVVDLLALPVDRDSLVPGNDLEHIRNDARYARVGSTQQPVEFKVSIGRFGRFSDPRTDLQCQNDGQVTALGIANVIRKGGTSIRVDEFTVTGTGKGEALLLLAAVDLDAIATFTFDAERYGIFGIRSITHTIRPLPGRVDWQATYSLDTFNLVGWPAGTLIPFSL